MARLRLLNVLLVRLRRLNPRRLDFILDLKSVLLALVLLACASEVTALSLGDELLAPAAPRPAPRSRPELLPRPAIFSSRQVLYAARAADGKRMVTVERGDKGDELWLHSLAAATELPRLLQASPVRLAAPALNADGTQVAFVDAQDDVKGDIWLMDLTKADAVPRRLTGRESSDDAPVFTVDGAALVYQRQQPGSGLRELVRLHLKDNRSQLLPIGIDAAFATPAPDGVRWVFVSRKADPNGDLWLWNEQGGGLTQLTGGAERDLYPAWEGADRLLFTRQSGVGGNAATGQEPGQIFRLHLKRIGDDGLPFVSPLTSSALMAVAPLPARDSFYFVAGLAGGGQVMSLPASGEIPDRATVAEQWGLTRILLERQPPDPAHARLAVARVQAREEAPTREGGLAGLALAGLMEQAGEATQAGEQYAAVARRYTLFPREAALAGIARIRLQTAQRFSSVILPQQRQELLREAQQAMKAAATGNGADAAARYLIDSARLLAEFGAGAVDQLSAVGLVEQVARLKDADRPLKAEAALRRAVLLAKLEKGPGALAALVEVATAYGDQEEWAEAAITAVLDQVSPRDNADQAALSALAERYRTVLPRLAMGAWNRQGDVAYRANEWARAKDAYRTVLEKFPVLATPTAAARFALAEVLYREERYAESKALYETEMHEQPEDTPLYQLARAAYIRKTVAAGENLYRLGEVAAARALFLDLIRYDGRSLEAHRGYIKSVAAMGQSRELLELYRKMLHSYPDDPVLLYATGLTLTYLPGREHLQEADRLIARAAERMPSSEYPPQTRGYLAEIAETVHGERGGLERALAHYRRAWLLNRPLEQPENRANLDLNIGNVAFLLGSQATAWKFYSQRLASGIPFDNPDTELIFQQRYGAVAFQMREKEAPISGYLRALKLTGERLNPARPLELFGRLTRRVVERLFSAKDRGSSAEAALAEQQAITAELERLGTSPPEAPPSAAWNAFDKTLRKLLERERALLASAPSWNREAAAKSAPELNGMLSAVEKELDAVQRLVETSAEIHDRLGLAYLEADRFAAAREQFDAAFKLNQGLGFSGNLASNRRSASIATYRESHGASGEEQQRLLRMSRDGFRELLTLIATNPPKSKAPAKRSGGLVELSANVALDKTGSTEAAFGFSAEQEIRLAEIYLARIQSELGEPAAASTLLRNQLQRYPADNRKIAAGDLYGVSLLTHRSAHVDFALGELKAAASGFQRSTLLSLQAANPVSAMLNLVNWGELLAADGTAPDVSGYLNAEARVSRLADGSRAALPPLVYARYHNDAGALLARLVQNLPDDGGRQALLYKALEHWDRTLATAADSSDREVLHQQRRQRAVAQLNRGAVLAALGLFDGAGAARSAALEEARTALAQALEWRALAALGRYNESLVLLEHLPLTEYDLQGGELLERFAPYQEQLAAQNPEQSFALLERLSELERVQLLGRGALGLDDPAVARLLRAAAPHLAEIDRLREAHAKGPAADKEYLQLRLQQEQALIDDLFGARLERLPAFYALSGEATLHLAAAAVDLSALSRAGSAAESPGDAFKAAQQRFSNLLTAFNKQCAAGKGGRLCRLLSPQPVELIDVQENLPGKALLRFTPLDSTRWLLFTIGGQAGIVAETIDKQALAARLSALPPVLAACEDPSRFSTAPVISWGLSASHLLQSVSNRKPFRRQVLDPIGWWQGAEPFAKLVSTRMNERLSDAHTLVLPARAGLLPEVPSLPGGSGYSLPLWEDEKGQRHPLSELTAAENLSLVVAPRAGWRQIYSLGHLTALLGVPSLLLADGTAGAGAAAESRAFVEAYARQSVGDARKQLPPGWLLMGDWGPDAAEAARLGKNRFTEYGKAGVLAHNAGAYPKALALFENALAIVAENPGLAKHGSQLHRYARESAFAAGFTDRAIIHADALVKGLAKEKPYSAEHADALLRLGLLQGNAERFPDAALSLKEAVGIFADLGLAKEQAAALADFGVVMENAVNYTTARTFFEEAAGLRQTLKDDVSLAEQYRNLGRIHDLRLNQYAVAEGYYARAGELYAKSANAALEAETLLERGRCQRLLGNFPAADRLYSDALAKVGAGDLRTRMRIVLEQANNAWFQGRYQEAFDLREQVEKSALAEKWPLEQVMAKNTGGLIWWTLGDNKRALLELKGALERAEKLAVRRDEVATTLNNIGLVQRESGDYAVALETLEKALAMDRKLGSRWAMAYDLRNLGQTRLKMGDAATALQQFTEAAGLAAEIGDKVNLAKIHLARGDAEAEQKQPVAAQASYLKALEIADELLLREVRWRALFGMARLQHRAGDAAKAVASYQQALETVEGLRAEIRLDQLKDGFLADKMDVYAGLVGLLVDLQRGDEAFAVAERSRSRNLIDILGRQRLSLSGAVEQELYDRQNRLKEQMLEQETLSVQAANPKERARYAQALEKLRGDYQDLLIDIERKRPELLSLVKVNPTTLDEIRAILEPGVVLLSYYQLPDRLLCWKIDHERATLMVQTVPARELSAKISSYRRMLQNLEPLEKQSRELYELLVAQPLANSGPLRAVGIVPHGSLHYLSFATLNDGRDYLVDRQKLFYLPASSVMRHTMSRRQPVKNLRILAVGNPDLGNSALDLPFAEREAGTLRWNYPDVTTLTRERASESWIREHISEFGLIHLASHGEFDPVNPLFSSIRLTQDLKADGRLQAEEVFGLDIRADLVVLSACQTGLGDIRSGDDVVGMGRAFIFAGTHSLMSSLWRVSDVSTAIMMKQFYRQYMLHGKAESLTRAMLHVKNRYPHPGYWGAFVLTGDYQ